MKILGFEITRATETKAMLAPVENRGGWWPIIQEWTSGAWQANAPIAVADALTYWAVFRCISIIASDVSKLRLRLVQRDASGIWQETESPAFSPVLRKPNGSQNRIQFFGNWMESKLTRGNTYVLLGRDARDVVTSMHVLDPMRCKPLIAENGSVFYELQSDRFVGLGEGNANVVVPGSEIIHDRWNTLYHPLVGMSPIYAAGVVALMGLKIQNNSSNFFASGANPGGVLTAPGAISDETAKRLKDHWDANYSGDKAGKVAVLGDGLKFEQMTMSATDAQLIEQLKWTDAIIAGAFGVPAYMINAASTPSYNNVEALNQQYYSQCLQIHLESIELCLDEGLGLGARIEGKTYGTEFELDGLLRMDTATKVRTAAEGLKGIFSPNEARKTFDLPAVSGGDAVYLQQQNYSLEALDKRDSREDPFTTGRPAPTPAPRPADDAPIDAEAAALAAIELKALFGKAAA